MSLSLRKWLFLFESNACLAVILTVLLTSLEISSAQVVSHELRRLAVSTNQFGIDALRALDRIEPANKVLVFCPVCLSSSLVMIMMGSSKYPVVSSLRQALYVLAMKPQELNKGYNDILEHIGINQHQLQQLNKVQPQQNSLAESKVSRYTLDEPDSAELLAASSNLRPWVRGSRNAINQVHLESSNQLPGALSLPNLMKLKEHLDYIAGGHSKPWWLEVKAKSTSWKESKEARQKQKNNSSTSWAPKLGTSDLDVSANNKSVKSKESTDFSQMSATSNIYIQRGLFMNYNYNLLLRQFYKTVIHPVDFQRHGEETRQHINSIVAASTEGKIKDLVQKGYFESSKNTKAMIISTFHFRGTLDVQMKDNSIQSGRGRNSRSFDRPSNQTTKVDKSETSTVSKTSGPVFIETEETLLKFGSIKSYDCSIIEIPFSSRLVSLLIIMPNHHNGTELILTKLNAQVLNDLLGTLSIKRISIEIPIIKFDRGPINIRGLMKELSLEDIFFGEKMYSTETGLNRWMHPWNIVHETSIDIGTINPKWVQPEDRLKVGAHDERAKNTNGRRSKNPENHIKLDKPFFYFVLDSINGLVITMGRIRQ